jgi:ABC-type dipeptide/oligopeptide/nickel transport system ATPase component
MKDGNIVEEGLTENLFESPAHEYTQELLAASIL